MKLHIIIATLAALWVFSSCEKTEVPIYDADAYVNFYDSYGQYRQELQVKQVNFYYGDTVRTRDTVWLKLVALGGTPKTDVHIKLRAYHNSITSTLQKLDDAESGVHYVPFESEEMQKLLIFHANQMYDSIPIILLRDPSIKEAGRRLTLQVVDSEDVKAADHRPDDTYDRSFATVYTADCLSQPTLWAFGFFLGDYGPVKHEFMVRVSGERWDDAFIKANNLNSSDDVNLQTYWRYRFRNELEQENAERKAEGLGPLTEKDGKEVAFPIN